MCEEALLLGLLLLRKVSLGEGCGVRVTARERERES